MTRAVRVVVLGGSSLFLAAAAHTAGGGTLPAPALLVVLGFLLGLTALVATARRVRLPVLLVGLAAQQLLLHLVFDAAAAASGCTTSAAGTHHAVAAGMHHAVAAMSCTHQMGAMSTGWPMVLAHVLATAATAWLLARGEAWCWRAAAAVVRAAALRPTSRRPVRRPRPSTTAVLRLWTGPLTRTAAPRGPPLSFA